MKIYVNEMLKKSFIRRNLSNYTTLVLIIKKFDENFRICVNYKALNVLIIKNRNCFSLIKKTFDRLCATKFYIKLNVIAIFNEIRIRKDNEKKNNIFNQIRIIQIRRYVFRFLQCFRNFSIVHQRNTSRLFECFLFCLFEQRFDLQQHQKKTYYTCS